MVVLFWSHYMRDPIVWVSVLLGSLLNPWKKLNLYSEYYKNNRNPKKIEV